MRLPAIQYKGVESLAKPDPGTEARLASEPYKQGVQLVETAYQSIDHYNLLKDQENALQEANTTTGTLGVLNQLEENQVNLNHLPPDLADAYRKSGDYDEAVSSFQEGNEFVPSHKVAQTVYDWANNKLKGSNDLLLNKRQQAIYSDMVGKDIRTSFEKAGEGIRSSQIQALSDQTDVAIEGAMATGNIDSALEFVSNGYLSGIYSPAAKEKRDADVFSFFQKRIEENVAGYIRDVQILEEHGHSGAAKALANSFNAEMKGWRSYGDNLIAQEQANEDAEKFRIASAKGEVNGAVRGKMYSKEGGVDAALAFIFKMKKENIVPKGVTADQYDKMLDSATTEVNAYKNALSNSVGPAVDFFKLTANQAIVNGVLKDGNFVPKSGKVYQAYSELFGVVEQRLRSDPSLTEDERRNAELDFMRTYGQIPQGIKNRFDSIRSYSPDAQLGIMRDYTYLKLNQPELADKYSGSEKAYLDYLADEMLYGGEGRDSVRIIEGAMKAKGGGQTVYNDNIEFHAEDLKPKKVKEKFKTFVNKFDGWFSARPSTQVQVRTAWEHNYRDNIGKGAGVDAAASSANKEVESMYGENTTDPRYPKGILTIMPPNKVYGEFAGEQFIKRIEREFADLLSMKGHSIKSFYPEADGLTTTQDNPTWKIMMLQNPDDLTSGYQVTYTMGDKRNVMGGARFMPDESTTDAVIKAKKDLEETLTTGEFFSELDKIVYDSTMKHLDTLSPDDNYYHLSTLDVNAVIYRVERMLRNDDRFTTYKTVGRNRRKVSIFDEDKFKQYMNERAVDAAKQAQKDYRKSLGLDKEQAPVKPKSRRERRGGKPYQSRQPKI